jgi:uncharacterized membrane protein YgdD (TMEM256/DUF423 family)
MQPNLSRLRLSAFIGFLAVGLGAMGAHALHDALLARGGLEHWQTAVTYHLPHAIVLMVIALTGEAGGRMAAWSWRSFLAGILLFSGSLYVLAYFQPKTWDAKWLASIVFAATPLGGLCLMAGWLFLALSRWRRPQ